MTGTWLLNPMVLLFSAIFLFILVLILVNYWLSLNYFRGLLEKMKVDASVETHSLISNAEMLPASQQKVYALALEDKDVTKPKTIKGIELKLKEIRYLLASSDKKNKTPESPLTE